MLKYLSIVFALFTALFSVSAQTIGSANATATGTFTLKAGQTLSMVAQIVGCSSTTPIFNGQPISNLPNQTSPSGFTANTLQQVTFTVPGNDLVLCGGQNYTTYNVTWMVNGFPVAPTRSFRLLEGVTTNLNTTSPIGFVPPIINNTFRSLCAPGTTLNGYNPDFTPICVAGLNGTGGITSGNQNIIPRYTITGALAGPSNLFTDVNGNNFTAPHNIASGLNPDVNIAAYGALGTDGTAPGNYVAGSNAITIPSGTNAQAGQLLVLHDATTQGSSSTITACSITSNVATLTANQAYIPGEIVYIAGFTGACAGLNSSSANVIYSVLANTETSTSFQVSTPLGNLSTASDNGTATQTADLLGSVGSVSGNTITPATVSWGSASMTPTITYHNSDSMAVGWAFDDTAAIQNAVNIACNLTFFPRGTVGLKYGRVLVPQGAFHITSTIQVPNCGHMEGINGAAGSRIIWDGPAGSTAFNFASNSSVLLANLELFSDSKNFAPAKFFNVLALIDAEQHWHDLTFNIAATQCVICLNNGFVNLHFDHITIRNWVGDAIFVKIPAAQNRSSFVLRDSTFDAGSVLGTETGIQVNAAIDFDTSSDVGIFGTTLVQGLRIEDQQGTQWAGSNPSWLKFTTLGNGGGAALVGQVMFVSDTFNVLNFVRANGGKKIAIAGTDDTTSQSCPTPLYLSIEQNNGVSAGWTSGDGTWCGGLAIAQIPEIADGLLEIASWNPSPGGDFRSKLWVGPMPANLVQDSGLKQPTQYWTFHTGWSSCVGCGFNSENGIQLANTGTQYTASLQALSTAITVTPGEIITFGGYVDCSQITSGFAGWELTNGTTNPPLPAVIKCSTTQQAPLELHSTVVIPSGVTSVQLETDAFDTTGPSGTFINFSRPFVYEGGYAPYQINDAPTNLSNLEVPIASGSCTGTATSSTTLAIPPFGTLSTACTATASATLGFLMTKSGQLANLTVRCGTSGVSSSSGVFTIFDRASGSGTNTNTGITVTYGTTTAGTFLQDSTHTFNYVKGDLITLLYTTQATETLASCNASFSY